MLTLHHCQYDFRLFLWIKSVYNEPEWKLS
jgi:hypothetical protein